MIHFLSLLPSPEKQGVQSVLFVEPGIQLHSGRLNHHHLAVEAGLFVHFVDEVVSEGPQKIAVTELKNPLWSLFQEIAVEAQGFQCCIS